jgi:hypothetical protein
MSNRYSKPKNETANDEESDVETNADQGDTDDHDRASDDNASATTEDIRSVGDNRNSKHGTD